VSRFVDVVGQAKMPVLELAGNYEKMATLARDRLATEMAGMGLALSQFYIENISLPPEVEQALDTRTKMGVLGNLDQYTRYQTAEAIRDAAQNPGGIAGAGAGIGAGVAIGQQMAGALSGAAAHSSGGGPPPLPTNASFFLGINGQQVGPFDLTTLAGKARDGSLARSTLVWKNGMAAWVAAETVPELQGFFANVPPPLPS
jgi:GYF domain 2/SPFH domain-Band 7 family